MNFHKEVTLPAFFIGLALFVGLFLFTLVGCGPELLWRDTKHPPTRVSPPVKEIKPQVQKVKSRCRVVGKRIGKYASVVVRRNCFKNGLTEVIVFFPGLKYITDPEKQRFEIIFYGLDEAAQAILSILKFKPKLTTLIITRVDGIPCYIFAVVGIVKE